MGPWWEDKVDDSALLRNYRVILLTKFYEPRVTSLGWRWKILLLYKVRELGNEMNQLRRDKSSRKEKFYKFYNLIIPFHAMKIVKEETIYNLLLVTC